MAEQGIGGGGHQARPAAAALQPDLGQAAAGQAALALQHPTNPTGMPITRAGGEAPAAVASSRHSSAVGALPISTTAPGCSARARAMPAAARVPPGGATAGAHCRTFSTGEPRVRRAIGATAAAAMAVSVRRGAPAARASSPAAQAPG